MTPCPARWMLLLLAVVPIAACTSGTSSSTGTTGSTAAPESTPACRATTPGSGGGGGTDILVPGDIADGVHFVTYHSPAGYHLDHPEGWAQQASGTTLTFTDKFNSIRVETAAAPAAPSVASAQNDVAALKASTPCFQAGRVASVSRRGGPAILVTYRSDSPPDPVTGKVVRQDVERYEFWQSGTQATVTLSSPEGSDNVDPWRKVTDSFGWGP